MQKYSLIVAVVLQLLFFISAHAEDYPDVTDSGLRIEEVVVTVSERRCWIRRLLSGCLITAMVCPEPSANCSTRGCMCR